MIAEYLTINAGKGSRAKVLAATYGISAFDVRKSIVDSGNRLIGCDVQAYNRQTMTEDQKIKWQKNISQPRTEFWKNIPEEDRAWRKEFFSKQMTETTARLKSDPIKYKNWRDSQKATLLNLYETTDLKERISLSVIADLKKNGPHNYKSNFEVAAAIDGKEIKFDSKWELSCYELLRKLGVNFSYASKHNRQNWFPFSGRDSRCGWNPDFIIEEIKTIIEVKSNMPVIRKNWEKKIPIIKCEISGYKIYELNFDISSRNFITLDSLLSACKLV